MKLNPDYSYEFNVVLNPSFSEDEQIKNFASLISDKDRFLPLCSLLEKNCEFIEKHLGFPLPEELTFYVVRAELFKSFSTPVTIEYSICPEEMVLYLLKEIVKVSITTRFPDEVLREQFVNSFVDFFCINADLGDKDFIKFGKNLHEESKKFHKSYEFQDRDFSKETLKEQLDKVCDELFS